MRGRRSLKTCALAFGVGVLSAVISAVGNYSIAQTQGPGDAGDQTAMAVPRIGVRGAPGVALPQPLPPSEAVLVRKVFALQHSGSLVEAEHTTARLQDSLLLGSILADRYLRTAYRATPAELSAWLTRFGDQPDAQAIRTLLERLSPASSLLPASVSDASRSARIRYRPSQARVLFVRNRDAEVIAAVRPLLSEYQPSVADGDALLVAGLAAIRLGQPETAAAFLDTGYRTAATPELRSADAFWAGRLAQRGGDKGGFAVWMRRAALEGDTFYGLLARRALGPAVTCLTGDVVGNADMEALAATSQGRRGLALLQVGERRMAEMELRALWVDTAQDGVFDRALTLTARAMGFTRLADEIEQNVPIQRGEPIPVRLRPASGFLVDPPLVYALVRHESNFRPGAVSRSGARGLMQIMPQTARAVAGGEAARLQDPAINLSIGQRYMLALADDDAIDGDLIRLLASYGQGQNGVRRWVDDVRDAGDPLMFIEAIPNGQTRVFVQEALLYSWQYAAQLHLPAASLDALAAGRYPRLLRANELSRSEVPCARTTASR